MLVTVIFTEAALLDNLFASRITFSSSVKDIVVVSPSTSSSPESLPLLQAVTPPPAYQYQRCEHRHEMEFLTNVLFHICLLF